MLRVKHLLAQKESGNHLWTVDAEDPVLEAIRVMAEKHVGALPVLRKGELTGIVSERDYARKIVLLGRSSAETQVWQIMTTPVVSVTSEDTINHCMQVVTDQRIRHLPVVDKGTLIGMISIGDLVKSVIEEQQHTITELERYIAS